MARSDDRRRDEDEEGDKDVEVSDDALELVDEDEEDGVFAAEESEDDKGWE